MAKKKPAVQSEPKRRRRRAPQVINEGMPAVCVHPSETAVEIRSQNGDTLRIERGSLFCRRKNHHQWVGPMPIDTLCGIVAGIAAINQGAS